MIGLGAMGTPMVKNLMAAGKAVYIFDIRQEAVNRLASEGAAAASSPRDLARGCELLVTMVTDDSALRDVYFGNEGILESDVAGGTFVDLSSTSVELSRELATVIRARGGIYLDGAVIGGGVAAARRGESPLVIAGAREPADWVVDALDSLGSWSYMGDLGAAKTTKVINNWLVGAMTASNGEALAIGMAHGVELQTLFDSLCTGSGESTVLDSYVGSYLETGEYGVGLIPFAMMEKDLSLACSLGDDLNAPALSAELGRQLYRLASVVLGEKAFPAISEFFVRVSREDCGDRTH